MRVLPGSRALTETYEDTMSGAKSGRPGLLRLLNDAAAPRFDVVICWKLDRFGPQPGRLLEPHPDAGAARRALPDHHARPRHQPERSSRRFLLHILGAAAEFERSLIRECVHTGIKAAKKAGKVLGRPKRVFNRAEVHELRRQGLSIRDISRCLDVGMGTVTRTLAEMLAEAA